MHLGKINIKEADSAKILVDEIISLEDARNRFTKSLCIALNVSVLTEDVVAQTKQLLGNFNGNVPVYLNIKTGVNGNYILRADNIKVDPCVELLDQLRSNIGRENVWVG